MSSIKLVIAASVGIPICFLLTAIICFECSSKSKRSQNWIDTRRGVDTYQNIDDIIPTQSDSEDFDDFQYHLNGFIEEQNSTPIQQFENIESIKKLNLQPNIEPSTAKLITKYFENFSINTEFITHGVFFCIVLSQKEGKKLLTAINLPDLYRLTTGSDRSNIFVLMTTFYSLKRQENKTNQSDQSDQNEQNNQEIDAGQNGEKVTDKNVEKGVKEEKYTSEKSFDLEKMNREKIDEALTKLNTLWHENMNSNDFPSEKYMKMTTLFVFLNNFTSCGILFLLTCFCIYVDGNRKNRKNDENGENEAFFDKFDRYFGEFIDENDKKIVDELRRKKWSDLDDLYLCLCDCIRVVLRNVLSRSFDK